MSQSSLSEIEQKALLLIAEVPHVPATVSVEIWKAIGDLHAKGLVWFRGGCWKLSASGLRTIEVLAV